MYTTYVLYSDALKCHYVGHTDSLERRLAEHNRPHSGFTARAGDWSLIYRKNFSMREAAAQHERRIKKTGVRVFLQRLDARLGLSPAARPARGG